MQRRGLHVSACEAITLPPLPGPLQVEQLLERAQFLPSALRWGSSRTCQLLAVMPAASCGRPTPPTGAQLLGCFSLVPLCTHGACCGSPCHQQRNRGVPLSPSWAQGAHRLSLNTASIPSVLCSAAELEVRDITSRPDWEAKYAMTIPVLAAAAADGSGEVGAGDGVPVPACLEALRGGHPVVGMLPVMPAAACMPAQSAASCCRPTPPTGAQLLGCASLCLQVALPRPSPRFTADALQKHIEKHAAPLLQD